MDAIIQNTLTRGGIVLLVAVLAAMLALVAGCPQDDTASMAQQMGSARPGATASGQQRKPDASQPPAGQKPDGMQPAGAEGGTAQAPGMDGTEQPGGTAAEEEGYDGPKVIIEDLVVKAPYPEYSAEGRYDLSFTVELEEAAPAAVWQLRALNEAGEVVGSLEEFLTLSYGWKKPLDFKGLFCSEMPVNVELRLTDKEPVQAAEEGEEGAAQGGGGSPGPDSPGNDGRGASGIG